MGTIINASEGPDRPTPADFEKFLPWASCQLEADYVLVITKTVQTKYVSSINKDKTKPKAKPKAKTPIDSDSTAVQLTSDAQIHSKLILPTEEDLIHMETTYDDNEELVRLRLLNNRKITRLLFQIIALAVPYHKTLNSLVINDGLCAETVYEISHIFSTNRITEICLDNTNFPEANYHILLDNDIIKHFSLSKCNITDVVVKTIASKLTNTSPASRSLSVLNLSTNRITDVGVKYLAEMLRSNRQLSYLNLADNKITDEGAQSILNTLTKFALTRKETVDKSKKLISYLNEKNKLILKTVQDLRCGEDKKIYKKKSARLVGTKKKLENETFIEMKRYDSMLGNIYERAEAIAESILGPFNNPFSPENTEKGETATYCLGNNTLSYLNIAFNNLTYSSVTKICDVLKSQNMACRKPKGLINIRIEGNCLPESCPEFQTIDDLLLPGLSILKNVESVKKKGANFAYKVNN